MSQGWHLKALGWDLNFRSSVGSQPAGVRCPIGLNPWGLGDSEGHIECLHGIRRSWVLVVQRACCNLGTVAKAGEAWACLTLPWISQWWKSLLYSLSLGFPVGLTDLQWACVKKELTLLVVWILFFIKSTWLTEPKLPAFHCLYKMPEPEVLSRLGLSIALCLLTWMSLLLLDKLSGNIAEFTREQ